jgi:hypothetical protein
MYLQINRVSKQDIQSVRKSMGYRKEDQESGCRTEGRSQESNKNRTIKKPVKTHS